MNAVKNKQEIIAYQNTKSTFSDHNHFEITAHKRDIECDAFINNREYTPNYDYPKLDFLIDNDGVQKKKTAIYEAVMELEAAKSRPGANTAELELFASFHEMRLKRIMLVEAARNLCNPISMSMPDINRQSFAELNEALYGEFDSRSYLGMISTEQEQLRAFVSKSKTAEKIKSELESSLGRIDVGGEKEKALLDEDTIQKLHTYVVERYGNVLSVVPDTTDDVYYDVNECAEIMNKALEVGGLAQKSWKTIENPAKSNPTTKQADNTINLPSNTRRNASELRRLIIHEQEVHARRGQNGEESRFKLIETGTADYMDIEEGFGVILECAVDGNFDNPSFDRARNRYITAGLALGAEGQPRDAREVYEILWRDIAVQDSYDGDIDENDVKAVKEKAYTLIENAYRGTQFWMKGVIFTKLKVYYEGLAKNAEYITQNIDNLDTVFEDASMGKYNHTSPEERDLVKSAIKAQETKK